jgi:hypothetical protein
LDFRQASFACNSHFPHHGVVTLAHCSAPRKMNGRDFEPTTIMTHYESDYGAATKVHYPKDQTVTCIVPNLHCTKWFAFRGRISIAPSRQLRQRSTARDHQTGRQRRLLRHITDRDRDRRRHHQQGGDEPPVVPQGGAPGGPLLVVAGAGSVAAATASRAGAVSGAWGSWLPRSQSGSWPGAAGTGVGEAPGCAQERSARNAIPRSPCRVSIGLSPFFLG